MEKLKKVPYVIMAANELAPENERSNHVYPQDATPLWLGLGPRLVTFGIWKPVTLFGWDKSTMKDLYIKPLKVSADAATIAFLLKLSVMQPLMPTLKFGLNKKMATQKIKLEAGIQTQAVEFTIEKPEL